MGSFQATTRVKKIVAGIIGLHGIWDCLLLHSSLAKRVPHMVCLTAFRDLSYLPLKHASVEKRPSAFLKSNEEIMPV